MFINGFPQDYQGNQHTWWIGRVIGIYEEQTLLEQDEFNFRNRVRVRIIGHQGPEAETPPDECPLADVLMPPTHGYGWPGGAGSIHGLKIMDMVAGFYLDHDCQMPVVVGVLMGGRLLKEEDDLLQYVGSGAVASQPSVSSSSSSTSTTAADQNTNPAAEAPPPNNQGQQTRSQSSDSSSGSASPTTQGNVVSTRDDGVEFSDNGVQGGSTDKSIPATIRHNNPLGNNNAGLANRYNPAGAGQDLDGTNTIASFNDTSDGYAYSFHQMHLNATRAGRVDGDGRLYTTPQNIGDEHQTAGYNGTTIVNALGNNDRLYFDTYTSGWSNVVSEMQTRETSNSLRTKAVNANDLPSDYDFGQNTTQMQTGFNKMQKQTGIK